MNRGKLYLSHEDLMILMGTDRKSTVYKYHRAIRDSIKLGKKNLTIWEYCQYTGDNYPEIYFELRGVLPTWPPNLNEGLKRPQK